MPSLVRVFAGRTLILLVLSCCGAYFVPQCLCLCVILNIDICLFKIFKLFTPKLKSSCGTVVSNPVVDGSIVHSAIVSD